MDSTVILHHALKNYQEVYCLTYNYKQRHKLEINKAINYIEDLHLLDSENKLKQHTVVDLGFYANLASASALTNPNINVPKTKDVIGEAQTAAYVPNRNTVMLSIAAGYAESIEAQDIFYGAAQADDTSGYWDCTRDYLEKYNNVLGLNRKNTIQVKAPLIDKSKKDIILYGIDLKVNFDKTLTCYNGGEVACGICPACSARIKGFIDAGYIDPVPYAIDVPWKKYNCKPILE
jgi:7-cyano-7-deazaguanine synthase